MSSPKSRLAGMACAGVACAALAFATAPAAFAQNFPNKPVRMLVGFAPGGATELSARVLSDKLGTHLGQTVILETRPGNAGQTAMEVTMRSPADGYLMVFSPGTTATTLPLTSQVQYDTLRDFAAVSTVAKQPLILVASPTLGVTDLAGLRKKLVAGSEKYAYGSAGTGSGGQITAAYFAKLLKTSLTEVSYKSSSNAIPDLMAGRLAIQVDAPSVLTSLIQSGKVTGIAVLDGDRVPGLNVPTIAEAGMPEYLEHDWTSWFIVLVPKATPAPIVERLNEATVAALKDEDLVKHYRELGLATQPRTAAASQQFLERQVKAWPQIFKEMGINQQPPH